MLIKESGLEDAGLDDQQRVAVYAPRGPLCVLAGAGTGKTRTITHRIAHLVTSGHVAAGQVLAVTFTARAAGEMRHRLRALEPSGLAGSGVSGVQALTFHAAARRQLRYFWPRVVGDTQWQLLDSKFAVVAQAASRCRVQVSTDDVRDVAGEIEWAKASLISPEDYVSATAKVGRDVPLDASKVAAIYVGYEALKASRDGVVLLDFDDLLLHTAAAIENDSAVAGEFRDRYRCFVVDEYQDVTPLQQRVLKAWLGQRDDLTVVGDANQTIYSFTGASPQYLLDFSRWFPDAMVVRLERDYRSTPQVVALANKVIAAARGRVAGSRLTLIGQREPGPAPVYRQYADENAEASGVAQSVKRLIVSGVEPAEIAVLYRVNAQSQLYEEALTEAGVGFQVRGGAGFFSRQEIRQALVALQRAAERGAAGLLPHVVGDVPHVVPDVPHVVRDVLEPLGLTGEPPAGTRARERWEALHALARLVDDEVAARPELTLAELVAELKVRADARHPPVVQGVTLMSMHAAKGLEWDAVFVVGLTEGTMPISYAVAHGPDSAAVEEERRLLYVGVTRARKHVELSWALARGAGARQTRRPSRFLQGIAPQLRGEASGKSSGSRDRSRGETPRCRVCHAVLTTAPAMVMRRCQGCSVDIDDQLLAELKAWRLRIAQELKVPAFVVFTDNTLMAIAEMLPSDDVALRAIPGVGARKLERFGPDVLGLVRARMR